MSRCRCRARRRRRTRCCCAQAEIARLLRLNEKEIEAVDARIERAKADDVAKIAGEAALVACGAPPLGSVEYLSEIRARHQRGQTELREFSTPAVTKAQERLDTLQAALCRVWYASAPAEKKAREKVRDPPAPTPTPIAQPSSLIL